MAFHNRKGYYSDPKAMCKESIKKIQQTGNVDLLLKFKNLKTVCLMITYNINKISSLC